MGGFPWPLRELPRVLEGIGYSHADLPASSQLDQKSTAFRNSGEAKYKTHDATTNAMATLTQNRSLIPASHIDTRAGSSPPREPPGLGIWGKRRTPPELARHTERPHVALACIPRWGKPIT